MARRLLSIWFPRLASEIALRRNPVEGAFALVARAGNADHLYCLNPAAEAQGLARGISLADARAICPDLLTRPADPTAEAHALASLRRWALRYAPHATTEGADGLALDITGAAHLLGGEAGLRRDLHDRLADLGLDSRSAIAGTRLAARAVARQGGGILAPDALEKGLGPLPIRALELEAETTEGLARIGLTRIRDLIPLPRAPLARRFGPDLVIRLDAALGLRGEPLSPEAATPHLAVRLVLPEPIGLAADVTAGLDRLLRRLCTILAGHHLGARRLRLELGRVDHSSLPLEIGLARPMRDPARILPLFAKGIASADAGHGIDRMRLEARLAEPLPPEQISTRRREAEALTDLLSSLGNRIGFARIRRLTPAESLVPEQSFHSLPASAEIPEPARTGGPLRPLTLFPPEPVLEAEGIPPHRFRWRRMRFTLLRAEGPERIAPDWWQAPGTPEVLRDYWRLETCEGPRLWLFHSHAPQPGQISPWFVQGEFA